MGVVMRMGGARAPTHAATHLMPEAAPPTSRALSSSRRGSANRAGNRISIAAAHARSPTCTWLRCFRSHRHRACASAIAVNGRVTLTARPLHPLQHLPVDFP